MPSDFCDTHYSYECGCTPLPAPVEKSPGYVWVVVELYTRAVQVGRAPATGEITGGRLSIFAKPEVQQQVAGRIVGVFLREKDARAVPHAEGSEYIIECHEPQMGITLQAPLPPTPQTCILCGVPASTTFCRACEQKRNAEMRVLNGDAINEQMPLVKSDLKFRHPLPASA